MSRGPLHHLPDSDGIYRRKKGPPDSRRRRRKERDLEWYVRLNLKTYMTLEAFLDLAANHDAGTHIPGVTCRADLLDKVFGNFVHIDALGREMGYRDVDELVAHMIEGFRFLQRQGPAPAWLGIEPPQAPSLLAPPRNALPSGEDPKS